MNKYSRGWKQHQRIKKSNYLALILIFTGAIAIGSLVPDPYNGQLPEPIKTGIVKADSESIITSVTIQEPVSAPKVKKVTTYPDNSRAAVQAKIRAYAAQYGVNVNTALRIAECESNFKWNANNPNSSATGVYQWTIGTWNWIGGGDRLDVDENIQMFMKYYPKYPQWWICK